MGHSEANANAKNAICHNTATPCDAIDHSEVNAIANSEATASDAKKRSRLFIRDDDTISTASETDDDDATLDGEIEGGNDHSEIVWDANPPQHWNLEPPRTEAGAKVDGKNKRQLRRENKAKWILAQEQQKESSFWMTHAGEVALPGEKIAVEQWKGCMCPSNLALEHPAAEKLLEYATGGCPANTGKPWTKKQMWAAVDRGPHISAMDPAAIAQLEGEIADKVKEGQCKVVLWNDIKDDPPEQLKISPLAMIPHKSRAFRAILDLSFRLRLEDGSEVPSVNEATTLEAPAAAIDQMGHALSRIIHAFAEADDDAKIFMAKFDIKDGFWRLDCQQGEEWNFAYVLPQREGEPVRLVVPTSLQMGWVESPSYFCAASETARDVAAKYAETSIGALADHKFAKYSKGSEAFEDLPEKSGDTKLRYFFEVYVDDFVPLAIASSKEQLEHVAKALLHGIHDVFPANDDDSNDPTSLKKLLKKEGQGTSSRRSWDLSSMARRKQCNLTKRNVSSCWPC
jgi:hypothetical protein